MCLWSLVRAYLGRRLDSHLGPRDLIRLPLCNWNLEDLQFFDVLWGFDLILLVCLLLLRYQVQGKRRRNILHSVTWSGEVPHLPHHS